MYIFFSFNRTLFIECRIKEYLFISFSRKDRITIQEKEREELKQKQLEIEAKKLAEEREINKYSLIRHSINSVLLKEKNIYIS
jgi:hypothetical protein